MQVLETIWLSYFYFMHVLEQFFSYLHFVIIPGQNLL